MKPARGYSKRLAPTGSAAGQPIAGAADGDLAAPERDLLARCLAGDKDAWEQLYSDQTPGLLRAARYFLGSKASVEAVEEINARVWYALLGNGGRLLRRYLPGETRSLRRFLAGVARCEVLRYLRAEKTRRQHELARGALETYNTPPLGMEVGSLLNEFASTLKAREIEFLEDYMLTPPHGRDSQLSATNLWQRRHRLKTKLHQFLWTG